MVKKHLVGLLAAGGLALSGLTARAEPVYYPLNGSTNIVAENVTQDASIDVNREITEYDFQASAGVGGNVSSQIANGWIQEGYTNRLVANPSTGYDFSGWKVDGNTVSTSRTNDFIVSESVIDVLAEFSRKSYSVVFRDERANVDVTNMVYHGENFPTNFPTYVTNSANPRIRHKATGVTADGVGIQVE